MKRALSVARSDPQAATRARVAPTPVTLTPVALSIIALSAAALMSPIRAHAQIASAPLADSYDQSRYSANQLDNLVGPIALYPDALLAQVLVAATFPDQIDDAASYVRANGTSGIDDQPWDVSVKSVAHYASALNMMADKSDWTATLGRAYANQSSDVMAAVQRMRRMADSQGNLVSNQQQQVVREADNYVIVPAQPRVIYVPVYDPVIIYTRPIFNLGFSSRFWSFGVGFPIGGWLSYDLDWGRRSVYYNGWSDAYFAYGGGWRARSRPFVQITNIYVNPRYRDVYVNRNVVHRTVNYRNVDRYAGVHRDTYFDRDGYRNGGRVNARDGYRDGNARGGDTRNGNDRGGDNRGGDNRNGSTRGGDSRNGDNRNGDNRGGDNRGGFPYGSDLGRRAEPRADRPAATPDGYRVGSTDRGTTRDQGGMANAPENRRREPVVRSNDMSVAPDVGRPARDNGNPSYGGNNGGYGGGDARGARPERVERAAPAPRAEQPSAPRQERARESAPRQSQTRSAQPRGERSSNNGDRGRGRQGA